MDSSMNCHDASVAMICINIAALLITGAVISWLFSKTKEVQDSIEMSEKASGMQANEQDGYEKPIRSWPAARIHCNAECSLSDEWKSLGTAPPAPAEYDDVGPADSDDGYDDVGPASVGGNDYTTVTVSSGIYEEVNQAPASGTELYLQILPNGDEQKNPNSN